MVSSVALIAMGSAGKILVTNHKERGWDIPGGHVEKNETIATALQREVREESGASFQEPMLIASITSDATEEKYHGKCMLIFATKKFNLADDWTPADDVVDRAILDVDTMLKGYHGDKDGMILLLNTATKQLGLFPPAIGEYPQKN